MVVANVFQGLSTNSANKRNQFHYLAEWLLFVWEECRKMVGLSFHCGTKAELNYF